MYKNTIIYLLYYFVITYNSKINNMHIQSMYIYFNKVSCGKSSFKFPDVFFITITRYISHHDNFRPAVHNLYNA
jgi:hypothetical protein